MKLMPNGQVTENKWTINRGETDFWFLYKYQNYIEVVIRDLLDSFKKKERVSNWQHSNSCPLTSKFNLELRNNQMNALIMFQEIFFLITGITGIWSPGFQD